MKYFKALQGIKGKTLFDRYPAIDTIVKKNIDLKYQDFLALPIKDHDIITFYSKSYKETPQLLSDLHGAEQEKYSAIKDETLGHYESRIASLKNCGKTDEAEFLKNALKYIDDRFVYCYEDMVVLGVWGMQLRENVREDISEIRKNLIIKKKNPELEPELQPTEPELPTQFTITYNSGENGTLIGNSFVSKLQNEFLDNDDIPKVEPNEGYEFVGWDENPQGYEISGNKEFSAQYQSIEVPPTVISDPPWYTRFWNWLRALFIERGCLKWLLWILLILLLIWLFLWLFRGCSDINHNVIDNEGGALNDNDNAWIRDDPNVGDDGGIYDPHNPYQPVPTPPGHEDILPPQQGVLPPIGENPDVIPGNPSIISNRLNILMENEDKSIMEFAKVFKKKYPDEKYKVVYYDNVVKRAQIEIPKEERERLKEEIPAAFAPEYELFVFDEALFEGSYTPNDPAISEEEKSWYLKAINALEAWEITQGSEKVTVAIVDNGFNLRHPELASKVVAPYNVWKHSNEIFPQQIDHGTHVAGIALAIADNGKGISGIAPNCKFMPVQVANENNLMTTTSVLDGILYSLYQGADVINVSLGGQFTGLSQFPENKQKELIRNHFKEEERLWRRVMRIAANHNSTLVIAAGNDNVLAGIDALQRPELFITVSATDKSNRNLSKAQFSNYGSYATISAPGVGIYSSVGSNDYAMMDGTSMAAPIVSGAVALMKSINNNITTKKIICILQSTGVGTQDNIGKFIQLDKALQMVKSNAEVDCTPSPSSGDVQIKLNWNNYNDLDLICTDPYGEMIFYKNRMSSSGGQLEIDMNVEYPDSKNPIENIFWETGSAPQGTYNIYIQYYKKQEPSIDETPYNIQVHYGKETKEYKGVIKKEDKTIQIGSFTVRTAENSPQSQPLTDKRLQLEKERNQLQQELNRVNNELKKLLNNS
ncbi:S8 family peptidase [Gelidibacter maritimus]|uniref:S8 family serine peptidase n=1 Tax=Gelidibacter maritimus TaxID=2761487 RepID=A0A7W2M2M2_9FLAO|nr:S8 family serine peptidase [Gelidibacter maritimus]MBA6151520.1 S8 family serine peptidase [Gelidibacter maritimus]